MITELVYLQDFDIVTCDAAVTNVEPTEDGRIDVQLDKTCFYPRGGGQDWDTGTLKSDSKTFIVEEVRLDQEGIVHHIGTFEGEDFAEGVSVHAVVDKRRRAINTRLHSGGHLIDMAIAQIGLPWIATKGAHYPHMCNIEYSPGGFEGDIEDAKAKIQARVDELLKSDYEHKAVFMPVEEMHTVCRSVPPNIPINKPARVMLYADNFGIPCGGTHTRTNGEIGEVVVTGVRLKKGIIKVNYVVKDINEAQK